MVRLQIRQPGSPALVGVEPLYLRVPTHTVDGTAYSDFMMLIPGLRDLPKVDFADRVGGLQAVLGSHQQVVFADLNVPLNLLWVTLIPKQGLIVKLAKLLRERVPEATLVGHE